MKHRKFALLTIMLLMVVMLGSVATACGKGFDNEKSPLVIATGELDGVFSPFFTTSGYDSQVVGMTQISMLGIDENGRTDYGDDVSTVVRYANEFTVDDRDDKTNDTKREEDKYYTTYQFVIKNGIKFADGEALDYKDVLFNLYMYLDPVYNGSSTMYSTDILGLAAYRTQTPNATSSSNYDADIRKKANERVSEFLYYYNTDPRPSEYDERILQADLAQLKKTFKEEELVSDWSMFAAGIEDYSKEYVSVTGQKLVTEVWQAYLVNWGAVQVNFDTDGPDPSKYLSIDYGNHTKNVQDIKTKHKKKGKVAIEGYIKNYCIDVVYSNYFGNDPNSDEVFKVKAADFIGGTATGIDYVNYVSNQIMSENLTNQDKRVPNVSGIEVFEMKAGEKFLDNKKGASLSGDSSGDVVTAEEITLDEDHWVLQIRIYGVDPKALMNFGFTVAPMHYYSNPAGHSTYKVDTHGYGAFSLENNHFGFPYADLKYMNEVVKSVSGLPMGAGIYQPSNKSNTSDLKKVTAKGASTGFYDSNIVYYVRNEYFETTAKSEDIHNAKIKMLRLAVTNATRLFDAVKTDTVHFADPSAKKEIVGEIENTATRGSLRSIKTRTNGYGYIGINAKYVQDRLIRQAIMFAMDTSLVSQYYPTGLVENIYRPISKESWAYPETATVPYYSATASTQFDTQAAKDMVNSLRIEAGYTVDSKKGYFTKEGAANRKLEYTFTVAGGNTDHPAYLTMMTAAELLNDCGFKIKVLTDPFALRKLSSGRLTVWAAAWNSSIDPDMYQVYHKDSKATSVLQWGYPSMLAEGTAQEKSIIDNLSEIIDKARKITDVATRKEYYSDALDLIMDLAVELPTYQRFDMYVYKNSIIDENSIRPQEKCTSYMGPLSEMWKLSFVNG